MSIQSNQVIRKDLMPNMINSSLQGAVEKFKHCSCNIKIFLFEIILHFGCTNLILVNYNANKYKFKLDCLEMDHTNTII